MARKPKTQPATPTPELPKLDISGSPADRIERRRVKDLLAYPLNARTHSKEQIEQIIASMREFKWTTPILIDESGVVIAGHGRLAAANKLGIEKVPVMIAKGWSESQKRAYRIADNQIPMNADWDYTMLRGELQQLKVDGYDIALVGFDDVKLVDFMVGLTGEPSAPARTEQLESLKFSVIVECTDEAEQVKMLERLHNMGLSCRALIS